MSSNPNSFGGGSGGTAGNKEKQMRQADQDKEVQRDSEGVSKGKVRREGREPLSGSRRAGAGHWHQAPHQPLAPGVSAQL